MLYNSDNYIKNNIDGLEVFVKVKLGIKLTDDEKVIYDSYDEDEKFLINTFINDKAFEENFENMKENIFKRVDSEENKVR